MITRGGMSGIVYYKEIRKFGLSEDVFYSLPLEYQKAIILAGLGLNNEEQLEIIQKKKALKRFAFEEKFKDKVLVLFKKNK